MAKKILSILCAIAMMVTMLSVAMVSVFAADPGNLGTVTREEKSFGSLAWADSTYSEAHCPTSGYAGQPKKFFGFINTDFTGDAMLGRGHCQSVTLTNKETVTIDGDFEFSFRYSYYNNQSYWLMPYADVNVGNMNIHVQALAETSSSTDTAPSVVLTYGDKTLSVRDTNYVLYTPEEIDAMYNAGKNENQAGVALAGWPNNSAVPTRYLNITVNYTSGVLTLSVAGSRAAKTDSAEVALEIDDVAISYTIGNTNDNESGNVGVGLSNWEGSYTAEEYIEGDAGEGENTGYVSNIASGTDLLNPSTLDIPAGSNFGVSTTVYAAANNGGSRLDFATNALWSTQRSLVSVSSHDTYNLGENFAVTATMIIINQQQNNNSSGYISLGDVKLSFDRPTGGATATDVTIKLTNGDTVLGTYTTQAASINDSEQFKGSQLRETENTVPNGTYTLKYENGLLSVLYRGEVLAFDDDSTTFAVNAAAFNGVKFSVGVVSTARTSFIGNCVYTDNTVVEVDPYAPNIENGTDLLEGCTGNVVAAGTSFDTGATNQATLTLDTTAHVFSTFGGVSTVTTANKNFGTNFEVSAKMLVANQSTAVTMGSVSIGDIKLTYDRPAGTGTNLVTITLSNGNTVLGTYTSPAEVKGWNDLADQFKNNEVNMQEPNGTYTFKYDGTNLSILFNGSALNFDTGSSFPIDAAAFNDVAFSTSLDSNGRAVFVYDCIYTNLTPVVDKDLAFCGAGLTLGNGIGIEFYVNPAVYANYTDVVASVTYTGSETAETYTLKDLSGYKGFTFDKYSPDQYDEFVFVQLSAKKNGALVEGNTVKYSVANYISNQRKNQSSNTNLMSVIDALEAYCVAFDAYIDGEEYTYAGKAVELTKENDYHMNKATIDNPAFAFTGCTLNFREAPTVLYAFSTTEEVDSYTFKITKQDGSVATIAGEDFVAAGDGVYYVYYRGVTATEMRNTITGQMFNGDTAASDAITYSVVSYAYYQYQKAEQTILYDVTQAMMAYGDAVCEYAGK